VRQAAEAIVAECISLVFPKMPQPIPASILVARFGLRLLRSLRVLFPRSFIQTRPGARIYLTWAFTVERLEVRLSRWERQVLPQSRHWYE
jgi:hypothetical protein